MHVSKLGRITSVLHVSLTQGEPEDQAPRVVGYLTQSNLVTESGISLPTRYALSPPSYPITSITALREGTDDNWVLLPKPAFHSFRKAMQRVQTYVPRSASVAPAIVDEWICFSSGERFTQESLGYVCDTFPLITAGYTPQDVQSQPHFQNFDTNNKNKKATLSPSGSPRSSSSIAVPPSSLEEPVKLWLPTLVLNLEFKKLLPPEGVEWLFVRCHAKQIKNGRMDMEIVILDEGGDIVALSSHVALIVSSDRQLGSKPQGRKEPQSRL